MTQSLKFELPRWMARVLTVLLALTVAVGVASFGAAAEGAPADVAANTTTISGNPPAGTVGQPYNSGPFTCSSTNSDGAFSCGVTNPSGDGNFYPGLTWTGNSLTGTPTQAGTYSVVVCRATDSEVANSDCQTFTFPVTAEGPSISGSAPDACVGDFYRYAYSGTDFDSYSISGSLPPGVASGSADTNGSGRSDSVVLAGRPLAGGTYRYTITVRTDGGSDAVSDAITICSPPSLSGDAPDACLTAAYNHQYSSGGDPTPSVSISGGALPSGLSLNGNGTISGTPTAAGTYSFTVTADNGSGRQASVNDAITITDCTPPTSGSPPTTNTPPPTDNPPSDNPPPPTTIPPAPHLDPTSGLQTANTSVSQGGTMPVQGFGCTPNAAVTLTSEGQTVGTAVADGQGKFSTTADLSGLDVGRHAITASCGAVLTAGIDIVLTSRSSGTGATAIVIVFFTALSALLYRPRFFRPSDRTGVSS